MGPIPTTISTPAGKEGAWKGKVSCVVKGLTSAGLGAISEVALRLS